MPQVKEITANQLDAKEFIKEKAAEISRIVGSGVAINALSGGVDSSTVTMLGHRALAERLKTYFIDNGIMREGEPQQIISLFKKLGVKVEIINGPGARRKWNWLRMPPLSLITLGHEIAIPWRTPPRCDAICLVHGNGVSKAQAHGTAMWL